MPEIGPTQAAKRQVLADKLAILNPTTWMEEQLTPLLRHPLLGV